ncbi:hypothetical protein [Marinifilum fragile]|uniref:hypothetical protein n=1 Tax=Marinifilum fragile TaxID=570161 RepID=UPI002AA64B8B|nr:hypothetical protein [Marinifilum fragile]
MKLKAAFVLKRHMEDFILKKLYEETQDLRELPNSIKREIIKHKIDEYSNELRELSPIIEAYFADDVALNMNFSSSELNLIIDEAVSYVRFELLEMTSK